MANKGKRISELTALTSASLDTTLVGVDNGTTYKVELDTLADAVASRVNILDRDRLTYLESVTSSFETKGRSVVSGSSQLTSSFDERYVVSGSITQTTWDNIASKPADIISSSTQISDLGFISSSHTDITSLNSFTSSQNTLNSAFTSGINARLQTSSFNEYTASQSTSSLVDRLNSIESVSGSWITESETGSFLTSLNGAITSSEQVLGNSGVYSSSAQINGNIYSAGSSVTIQDILVGAGTTFGKITTDGSKYISVMPTYNTESARFWPNGNVTIQTGGDYVDNGYILEVSGSTRILGSFDVADGITGSTNFDTIANKPTLISGSSQLTSSFDERYTLSGSVQNIELPSNLVSGSSQLTSSYDSRYSLSGSVLTSFSSSVDSRLDTLEASIITGSVNYVQTLGARVTGVTSTGVTIITGSITTTGNPVQIMVTGDANPVNVLSWSRLQIYRDSTPIGNIVQVENSSNLNVPYCINVIDTPSAGTYTYSMRTVSGHSGTFDFGEAAGPTLTIVELKTNTNLPSTNNTFTGNNTFRGTTTFGTVGGDEGGEINFGIPATNTTLENRVATDVFQNRYRIFEGSANAKGVYIDLAKAPNGVGGELMYKASGFVNKGVDVTLGNLKARIAASGNVSLQLSTISGTYSVYGSSTYSYNGIGGITLPSPLSITTTPTYLSAGYTFTVAGATDTWNIMDTSAGIAWRITMILGASYLNNFISIERLH